MLMRTSQGEEVSFPAQRFFGGVEGVMLAVGERRHKALPDVKGNQPFRPADYGVGGPVSEATKSAGVKIGMGELLKPRGSRVTIASTPA